MKDLVAFVTDRKVNELSYGGLREMENFIRERLGVELFATPDQRQTLGIFIELRNIHTHNRGVVNELFLNRIASERRREFSLGKYHAVDFDDLETLGGTAVTVAISLDEKLCAKFRLKTTDFHRQLTADRKKWRETIDLEMSRQVQDADLLPVDQEAPPAQ